MPINLTGLTRFGDMTSGNGLAGIADGNLSTTGYAQTTQGYFGVSLASPTAIQKAEVVSATNGFDASGSTSQITLKLYGKTGSAPTSLTNGTLLGTTGSFIDTNSTQTKIIMSTDPFTSYDHVWVAVFTGVWSILSEAQFFESVEPIASSADRVVLFRRCDDAVILPNNTTGLDVAAFHSLVKMDAASVAKVWFQANFEHRGNLLSPQFLGVLGVGATLGYRYATTFAGLAGAAWTYVASTGDNIYDKTQHYAALPLVNALSIAAGYTEWRVLASAHTSLTTQNDLGQLLIEGGRGLNGLLVEFDKGAALLA